MTEYEFRDTLDSSTTCPGCGTEILILREQWRVGPHTPGGGDSGGRRSRRASAWIGLCVVQCPNCPWKKAAAAGSTQKAHEAAQAIRSQLLRALGL